MKIAPRLGFALLFMAMALPAAASEPACPLDLTTCLSEFGRMKQRPWLGVGIESDSTGQRHVTRVEPGSPAQRAGIRPGDVIESIEGKPPAEWFATKAGWGPVRHGRIDVRRGGRSLALRLPFETIPEQTFARIVGIHMVEGHLAYMDPAVQHGDSH